MKGSTEIRKSLAQCSRKIAHKHLVMGAMGNISVRSRGEVWIKRGGVWMETAKPSDFIRVRHRNKGLVSKEINLHLGCYKARPDIGAVIHTHPFVVTAVGTALAGLSSRQACPERSRGARRLKGPAIIKHYKPGSIALARAVSRAIKKADSVIMANHGLVVVGRSLKQAYQRTIDLEKSAGKLLMRLIL